jgi:iron(III) transport system ATP-binding protein
LTSIEAPSSESSFAEPAASGDSTVVVEIRDLVKSYPPQSRGSGRVLGVKGVSFEVYEGEFFTMLGPSGCGKTTTLRSVAGLEAPDSGEIVVAGRTLFSSARRVTVPVNERGIGMVFQSYAIWPHMSVFENVAFPLRVMKRSRRPGKAAIRERVESALATVQLAGLEERRATNLSGGQQQRLALARALVAQPALMLLDEPLSNLDAKLRDTMRYELKRFQRELRFTSMYVTHDQVEALALSNRIAVMNQGEIQQIGRPREIYENPTNQFVADFIGRSNFLPGKTVQVLPDGQYEVATQPGNVLALGMSGRAVGDEVIVAVRPEHVRVERAGPEDTEQAGLLRGMVESRQFLGEYVDYLICIGDTEVQARTNPSMSFQPGTEVTVELPPEHCRILQS